jgi:hypothetical protein
MPLPDLARVPNIDSVRPATFQDIARIALVEQTGDEERKTQALFHGIVSEQVRIDRAIYEWHGILCHYRNWIIIVVEDYLEDDQGIVSRTGKNVNRGIVGVAAIVLLPNSPRCRELPPVCLRMHQNV